MMIPSVFFGAFSFTAVLGLTKAIEGTVALSPAAHSAYASRQHRKRKDATIEIVGTEGVNSVNNMLINRLKKPSDLDAVKPEIDKALEGKSMPSTSNYVSINPNPKTESRKDLARKFRQVQLIDTLLTESKSYQEQIEDQRRQALQQAKINTATVQDFQGFFNKRLSTIRDSYSFLALQKLDRQMELLSQIEYEGNLVYDKLSGIFGSINYHVLTAIFKKQNDGGTLTFLENLVSGIGAFIMGGPAPDSNILFDPEDVNLKYPLNDNDNPDTELMKSLFNIIYKYKDRIQGNDLVFDHKTNGDISDSDISALLGINEVSVWHNIQRFTGTQINPATYNLQDNSYLKIKASIKRAFAQMEDIEDLMEGVISKFAIKKWGEIPLTLEIRSIFSTYAAPIGKKNYEVFSQPVLSVTLGRARNYINKIQQKGTTNSEKVDKFFRLTALINLIDETKVRPYEPDGIDRIKKECMDVIFENMKKLTLISSSTDMRPLFDLTNQILDTLTIATNTINARPKSKRTEPQGVYSLTDLSRIASKRNIRTLFYQKFKFGRPLARAQGARIITELRRNYFSPARAKIDITIDAIKDHSRINEPQYHKYFKTHLYNPQIFELFSITLGIDVFAQSFIEDATQSQSSGKYILDVDRHHPLEVKSAYTIFDINQLGFLVNLIPLMRGSHMALTNLMKTSSIENQLSVARFLHMYELIQKPYEVGKDYSAEILNEFKTKTAIVYEGNQMWNRKLWDDFNQEEIEKYIIRWIDKKEDSRESVFEDDKFFSKNYPEWYFNSFKPEIDDYYLYLDKSSSCKNPDFWHWFVNTYLRENFYRLF